MADASVTVKSAADGSLLLFSKTTGHLLQKLPSPPNNQRNRVVVSSGKSKTLTAAAKTKLIHQIRESGKDLEIVLPALNILPNPSLVARQLMRQRRGVTFNEKWGSESRSSGTSGTEEIDTDSIESVILLSAGDSNDVSDVSSLATASWTPSEKAHDERVKSDKAKQVKRMKGCDASVRRVNPFRAKKAAANKRLKKRKGRVYDF